MTKRIHYEPNLHQKHMMPDGGMLPPMRESAALWEFCRLAQIALKDIPEQMTLADQLDTTVDLWDITRSVLVMYQFQRVEDIFIEELYILCQREARRCEMPWDDRLDAWFYSGGKSYRIVTRDPDRLNRSN